jgi:hypothetical protein
VTNEVGNVDSEYDGSGVSGVVGGVRYAFAGLVGTDRGGGIDFGGGRTRGLDSYLCQERWQERDWWTLLPVVKAGER